MVTPSHTPSLLLPAGCGRPSAPWTALGSSLCSMGSLCVAATPLGPVPGTVGTRGGDFRALGSRCWGRGWARAPWAAALSAWPFLGSRSFHGASAPSLPRARSGHPCLCHPWAPPSCWTPIGAPGLGQETHQVPLSPAWAPVSSSAPWAAQPPSGPQEPPKGGPWGGAPEGRPEGGLLKKATEAPVLSLAFHPGAGQTALPTAQTGRRPRGTGSHCPGLASTRPAPPSAQRLEVCPHPHPGRSVWTSLQEVGSRAHPRQNPLHAKPFLFGN